MSQLQTTAPPANSWVDFPSALPPSTRDLAGTKASSPAWDAVLAVRCQTWVLFSKKHYSAMHCDFRVTELMWHRETPSPFHLSLSRVYYMCLCSYFLDAASAVRSLITLQYFIFHYLFLGWKSTIKTEENWEQILSAGVNLDTSTDFGGFQPKKKDSLKILTRVLHIFYIPNKLFNIIFISLKLSNKIFLYRRKLMVILLILEFCILHWSNTKRLERKDGMFLFKYLYHHPEFHPKK